MRRFTQPADVSDALGIPFSAEQLAAITAPLEPGVIIAGAGTGKTAVMAARVVWLVGTGAVRPEQVLGLTFTRKAAAELSHRVRRALDAAGVLDPDDVDEAGEQLVMTYDAFAARLVNDHGLRIGVEGDQRMITGAGRFRLASRVVAAAPGPFASLSRLRPDSITERLLSLDAELSSHLVDPTALHEHTREMLIDVDQSPRSRTGALYASMRDAAAAASERAELADLTGAYQQLKRDLGLVEFADQMAVAARLAREVPEVSQALRGEFAVVLLDEFQDTSSAQSDLLRALFSGNDPGSGRGHPVTAVGDPCQAIYGWRGAAASNITHFADHFPRADGSRAGAYALTVNRRSGQTILDAANELARPLRADSRLSWEGIDNDLVAPDGVPAGDITVAAFDTWPGEVGWIADRIIEAHDSGVVKAWYDIAVLTRRNANIGSVFEALRARDVPVEIVGLGGLLTVPEVADVVSMLSVVHDTTANPDLVRLLTGPRWAIGPGDLAALGRRAAQLAAASRPQREGTFVSDVDAALAEADESTVTSLSEAMEDLGDAAVSDAGRERLASCAGELRWLRAHAGEPVADVVRRVIAVSGLDTELRLRGPDGTRQLDAFVAAVSDYSDIDGDGSLGGLLDWLAAERDHGVGLEQAVISDADSVKVLTMHKAKGLEWELVFLPAMADTVFPSNRLQGNWVKSAGVLPASLRGDAEAIPQLADVSDAAAKAYDQELRDELRRADDRLAYVAVTRARQHLVATTHTWFGGLERPRVRSPYLEVLARHGTTAVDETPAPTNPLSGDGGARAWPAPVDDDARATRLASAAEVTRARRVRQVSGALPVDDVATLDDAALLAEWDAAASHLVGEARRARDGRPEIMLPRYLSASAVMALRADPDAYALAAARPMPRPPAQAARDGELFHAWLERRFNGPPTLLDADSDSPVEGASAALAALCEAFERGRYADRVPVACEVPFALVIGGQVVRGRLDAVFDDGEGGHQIVDWKTGSAHRADPLQLAIYRLAWAGIAGVPVERVDAVFFDVTGDQVVRPTELLAADELERLVAGLVEPPLA